MMKKDLLDMLVKIAVKYKSEDVVASLKRNNHMNEFKEENVSDDTIDAILVDYINRVACFQGVDLGLYTKDLAKELELMKG